MLDRSEYHALFCVAESKFNCPLISKPLLSQSGSEISQQRPFCLDMRGNSLKKVDSVEKKGKHL